MSLYDAPSLRQACGLAQGKKFNADQKQIHAEHADKASVRSTVREAPRNLRVQRESASDLRESFSFAMLSTAECPR